MWLRGTEINAYVSIIPIIVIIIQADLSRTIAFVSELNNQSGLPDK